MKREQLTENFFLDEFFPYDLWKQGKEHCLKFMEWGVIENAELFREILGKPIFINTWFPLLKKEMEKEGLTAIPENPILWLQKKGLKPLYESGVRMPTTKTGRSFSKHKFIVDQKGSIIRKCCAADLKASGS